MLIASGIVCVILPKDKPVHLSLIHLPRIPIGSVQVIEIINQFVVEFHDCSCSCFQKPLGGCMARCIKQNHAAQRHCEKQSVSSAVRASVGMFSEGLIALMRLFPAKGSGIPSPQGTGRRSHGRTSGKIEGKRGEQWHSNC